MSRTLLVQVLPDKVAIGYDGEFVPLKNKFSVVRFALQSKVVGKLQASNILTVRYHGRIEIDPNYYKKPRARKTLITK